jgi:hypothetical protein
MGKIAWEKPENCPVVNGYVIRVMTTAPEPPVRTGSSIAPNENNEVSKQISAAGKAVN